MWKDYQNQSCPNLFLLPVTSDLMMEDNIKGSEFLENALKTQGAIDGPFDRRHLMILLVKEKPSIDYG